MPIYEGEEQTPSHGGPPPSQRLLNWIQYKVPDLPIKNFTTDWNDGRAIGALVDSIGPGDFSALTTDSHYDDEFGYFNSNFK